MPRTNHNAHDGASYSVVSNSINHVTIPEPRPGFYGDACIHAGFNPHDSLYDRELTFTYGAKAESKDWKPQTRTLRAVLANLCNHVIGPKNGPAFVCGEMAAGARNKNAVKTITAIAVDIDTGKPLSPIRAALDKLGCVAVVYTTHSHLKTTSEYKKQKVLKFAGDREIDDELIRDYMREVEHIEETIVASAEFVGVKHTERGIMVQVSHPPLPKHRVIVPLAEPFVIMDEGRTEKEAHDKWAKMLRAFAALIDVPLDESCLDVSRLFFLPRHKEGRAFEAAFGVARYSIAGRLNSIPA